jgi:hypothetical protein
MIEKTWDISGGLDAPLKDIAKIIYNEVNGFISDKATPKSIVAHFKRELKKSDFTDMTFEIAGCKVAYNVCKVANQIALSSAFDLPRGGRKVSVGPFEVGLRLENFYLCLDTSKATDVIQFYLAMERFGSTTTVPSDAETVKTSELFKFFEDLNYELDGDKSWHKTVKNSAGKMIVQIMFDGSLEDPIYKYHMDMLSVAMAMIEAE